MPHLYAHLLLPGILFLFHTALLGQTTTFQKIYGSPDFDSAYDVLETPDGYLIAGETVDSVTQNTDALLIRTDKTGAVLWQKTYGQFDNDAFSRITVANDGGFIAWGYVRNLNLNRTDAWLVKVDDNGDLVWQKIIGQPGFNESGYGQIIAMPDGYILSGVQSNPGYSQSFFLRVNNNGETVWSRFTPSSDYNALRASYLVGDRFYVGGTVNGLGCWRSMDPMTGDVVQSREFRADSTSWGNQLYPTPDSGHLLSGELSKDIPGLIRINGWLQKLDAAGQVLWSKSYKAGNVNMISTSETLADGSSIHVLTFYPIPNSLIIHSVLFKINAGGDVLWARTFGSGNQSILLSQLRQTADGGFIALGYTTPYNTEFNSNVVLIKTDTLGIVENCCVANPTIVVEDMPPTLLHEQGTESAFENTLTFPFAFAGTAGLASADFCSNEQPVLNQVISLCPGETVTIGDSTYSQPGTVSAILPSTTGGCDTLATYTLELLPLPTLSQTIQLCPGETVTLGGTVYNQSGVVTLTLPSTTGGCDTSATYTLELLAQPTLNQTIQFCPGETVTLGGTVYNQSGVVTLTLPSTTGGCDTLATYTLEQLANPTLSQTIQFCPGETVTLGGTAYTQPGVVTLTLPSGTGGCDTSATYTLEYKTENFASALQLNCPANLVVGVAPGATSAPVTYQPATASSDCPCPELTVALNSGGASGTLFPLGVSTVCYRAEDACGTEKTCCFTITVAEDNVCDSKTTSCVKFELFGVNRDAGQQWVYRVRITNTCNAEMTYAYVQVPGGVQAIDPAQNSLYTGTGGQVYTVRNPNFSPFHSIRFKPNATGLANGQSDVFRYVLPEQVDVDYIHVAARLTSGVLYEAYLNTFSCPVGVEPVQKPAAGVADRSAPVAPAALHVAPNPVAAGTELQILGGDVPEGIFVLQDLTGRRVLESPVLGNRVLQTPAALANGIYFFKIIKNGQPAGSGKLLIQN